MENNNRKPITEKNITVVKKIIGLEYYFYLSEKKNIFITPRMPKDMAHIDEVSALLKIAQQDLEDTPSSCNDVCLISYVEKENTFYLLKGDCNISYLKKPKIIFSGTLKTMEDFMEGLKIPCYNIEEAFKEKNGLNFLLKQGAIIQLRD